MVVSSRDEKIVREIGRWRGCLGRQIKVIGGFTSTRATDRRLKKLIEAKFLTRKKFIYGLAGIYQVTRLAQRTFGLDTFLGTVRLDQAPHDMAVVDTYLFAKGKLNLPAEAFISEKELRHEQGFITRGHVPDFLFKCNNELYCVEVELSQKGHERLEKNVADNYVKYKGQKWIVPKSNNRVIIWLKELNDKYPNIEIVDKGVIDEYIRDT